MVFKRGHQNRDRHKVSI